MSELDWNPSQYYQEDFLASHSAQPGSEEAKRMGLSVRVETLPRWEQATEVHKLNWLIHDVIVRK